MSDVLGALDGVKIVDLTQMLAGPFCTMLLADQGAEIIKVEPLDGDHTRIVGPYHADDKLRAFGGYFASVNRNKRSIAVDLKDAASVARLKALAEAADVVLENFRSGVLRRLTETPGDEVAPSFSRDGTRIYFAARAAGAWQVQRMPRQVNSRANLCSRMIPGWKWTFSNVRRGCIQRGLPRRTN